MNGNVRLRKIKNEVFGRPLDLGWSGFSNTLPTLLFALPAGVFVEHWDKRRTVILFQAIMSIQAFGLAFLTFTGHFQIWHIVFLAFFYGSAVAVEVTARQAMLIELAGRDALPSAIALQTTAFNLGRVLGPLCAAWLISTTGNEGSVFLANGSQFRVRDHQLVYGTNAIQGRARGKKRTRCIG